MPSSVSIPAPELMFETPNKTAQLETTTSFAEMPAIRATAICQNPNPIGAKNGTSPCPKIAPKLSDISVVYPCGPKFKIIHIRIDAIKIVVPAFVR